MTTTTATTIDEAVEQADLAYSLAGLQYSALGREAYRAHTTAIEEQLAADLARLFPTHVADRIWQRAWADHHSEGYQTTAYAYQELAELVAAAELAVIELWKADLEKVRADLVEIAGTV